MKFFENSNCSILSALTLPTTDVSVVEILMSNINFQRFKKGEYIFISEQEVEAVIGINSGLAKFYFMDHYGKEFIVKMLKSGDIVGYMQILENDFFLGYIQVIEDTEVCMLSKSIFLKILALDFSINRMIIDKLCCDLRIAKQVIANLSLNDLKHRICAILINLHRQFSVPGSFEINADLSREDFAKLVGVARESLSRGLSELVSAKVISIERKKIKILNWTELNALSKI